ncbi:MAG TPA: RNA polymerase sigma factor [Candidatus Acidoferrum sp.]|jgi:RNA polymerase sigma-70 factor (ECF subfamily)|nr:RNA polymerase sigma factor [Candidatus Acidoferrum sp.]
MNVASTLVQEAAAGDQQAFMILLEPLLPAAHRLAVGMLRSESDAEDAVQEAAYKAWRHFGRFRRGSDLRPWLLTIVANECRHQRRSRWWSVVRSSEAPDELVDGTSSVDPATMDLRRALYGLPHDQRLVLILRYYLDLTHEEVAVTLGISTKAAKSRIYRALERLRLSPEVLPDE